MKPKFSLAVAAGHSILLLFLIASYGFAQPNDLNYEGLKGKVKRIDHRRASDETRTLEKG